MRQMWAGNEAMLLRLMEDETPLGRARLDYFLVNRGPWSRLDDNAVFVPGAPAKPEAAQLLPVRRDQGGRRGLARRARRGRARGGDRLLHDHPARRGGQVPGRAVQPRVPGRARRDGAAPARCRVGDDGAHAEGVPGRARRCLRHQRLLRERRRLDEARLRRRADDRALRGVRGRLVQLQGGVRGLHHGARRRRDRKARALRAGTAVARGPAADRPGLPPQEARRARADARGQRRVRRRRRQPRRADRRLQPAERRAHRRRDGLEAHDAQELPAGEVRQHAAADLESRAGRRGPGVRRLRRFLHAHPDARGHARPRADQHRAAGHRRRRAARRSRSSTARSRRPRPTSPACGRCRS